MQALPRSSKMDNMIRYPHLVMSKEFGLEKRYSAKDSRIHDGEPAELGQFPFAVHVQMPINNLGSSYVCTGSLISNDIVVTAAHCMEDVNPSYGVTVQYGVLNWGTAPPNNVQSGLSDYAAHEDFTFNNFDPITSDIGYTRLSTPLDPADWDGAVDIIPIADSDPNVDDIATEIGWGATCGGCSASYTLNWAQSNVVSDDTAWDTYGVNSYIAEEFFCTDSQSFTGHSGTCGGDSGGPATSSENFADALLWGATSFGSTNCELGYSCFTSVPYFRSWLTENTGEDFGP